MSLPQPGDATGIDWFNVVTLKLAQKIELGCQRWFCFNARRKGFQIILHLFMNKMIVANPRSQSNRIWVPRQPIHSSSCLRH